jgi:hypothetical protein
MRTTLNLDEDVVEIARSHAWIQGKPVGEVVSELARKGLARGEYRLTDEAGFPSFAGEAGVPLMTTEMFLAAE